MSAKRSSKWWVAASVTAALAAPACTVVHGPRLHEETPASKVDWVSHNLYPFKSNFLKVNGGNLHYIDEGPKDAKSTLVFVHGTPTWSFMYRDMIRDLSKDHRCIALDHIGYGLSSKPEDWEYTPKAHSENMAVLLEHLKVDKATVVVHDFGGPIGLGYAVTHPQRVDSIVMFNTFMWSLKDYEDAKDISDFLSGRVGRYLYLNRNFSPVSLLPDALAKGHEFSEQVHAHYYMPFPEPSSRVGPLRMGIELIGSSNWFDSLYAKRDQIADKKTLILWGMEDKYLGEPMLRRWQGVLRNEQVVELKGVGHLPQEEAPDRVVQQMRTFLAQRETEMAAQTAPLPSEQPAGTIAPEKTELSLAR